MFYGLTTKDIYNGSDAISYLLEDDYWWLWSTSTYREVFRMLNKYWSQLGPDSTGILINAILKGPPRNMFRDDLTSKQFNERVDREIWLKLTKLQLFGRDLPEPALSRLEKITKRFPQWKLRGGEQDEFTAWFEVGSGLPFDITMPDLFKKDINEIVEFLSEENQLYHEGRISAFRDGCRLNPQIAIKVLSCLSKFDNWYTEIWSAGLNGLSGHNKDTWLKIAPMLVSADKILYKEEPWSIANWTRKTVTFIQCGTEDENYFWSILVNLLNYSKQFKSQSEIKDAVSYAINNPVGIITEALMERFSACNLKVNDGVPKGPLRKHCNLLLIKRGDAGLPGKIILASRLYFFYAIDPKWTRSNLVPLFNWETSDVSALIWQGYLRSPRISPDLALDLKIDLLKGLGHLPELGDDGERLIHLFVIICLQHQNLYKTPEKQLGLESIGVAGLECISEFLYRTLRQDAESADNYWKNRIKPLLISAWPKPAQYVTEKTSKHFALMVIELQNEFDSALEFLRPFIKTFPDISRIVNTLIDKKITETNPNGAFRLLKKIFSMESQLYPEEKLRKVMNQIVKAEPDILNDPVYRHIDDYLVRHDY